MELIPETLSSTHKKADKFYIEFIRHVLHRICQHVHPFQTRLAFCCADVQPAMTPTEDMKAMDSALWHIYVPENRSEITQPRIVVDCKRVIQLDSNFCFFFPSLKNGNLWFLSRLLWEHMMVNSMVLLTRVISCDWLKPKSDIHVSYFRAFKETSAVLNKGLVFVGCAES